MSKVKIAFAASLVTGLFARIALFGGEGGMDLYLLIGQSNMAGRGKLTAENRVDTDRIFKLDAKGQWQVADEPIHFDKKVAGAGLAASFARTMADRDKNVKIGLIPCAVGGTGIDRWVEGGDLWSNAVARTKIALKSGTLKGILWHQGEHDATPERLPVWGAKMESMVKSFRREFGDVPFVAGELGWYLKDFRGKGGSKLLWREINAHLHELEGKVPNFRVVSAEGLGANRDKLHFNTEALREFGRRYAAAFMELEDAAQKETFALQRAEFAKYYKMITGNDAPEGVVRFAIDPKVSKGGRDSYLIRSVWRASELDENSKSGWRASVPAQVTITGSNLRSVWYGLYDLLERRGGCHWFWDGDVVPKKDSIDLSNLDVYEEAHFEYRAIRYFAHRGLTRFQAEHWGLEDWKKEIDWILKRRLNVFMLRIGQDDLFQRTFPDTCAYPDPAKPLPGVGHSHDDRTLFWSLQYRGKLRDNLQKYAFERGLMVPEDFGTMTHWYSRTPEDFLAKKKPEFIPLANKGANYQVPNAQVWNIRDDKWVDEYWKMTKTAVDTYGKGAPKPQLLHTIGLGERMCYKDRKQNFDMKILALDKFLAKAHTDYPDAKVLLAGWDFYSTWRPDEVKALLPRLDPKRDIIWDYEGDVAPLGYKNNFTNWGLVGKFPYTFSMFLAYENALDIRANYPIIEARQKVAQNDPFCKGYILWPESSHTDTLGLRYFTANAWSAKPVPHGDVLDELCASRYGKSAETMKAAWKAAIPASYLRGWGSNYGRFFAGLGFDAGPNAPLIKAWKKPVEDACAVFSLLANLPWNDEFIKRDSIDIARMVLDRLITLRTVELCRDIAAWRKGEAASVQQQDALVARAEKIVALCDLMADLLALHTDYSLWETYQRLDAIEKIQNPLFEKTLFENASCPYCRSHQYELARHWYAVRARKMADSLAKAVATNDRTAKLSEGAEDERKALKAKPLESLRPTLPRTDENFRRVLRGANVAIVAVTSAAECADMCAAGEADEVLTDGWRFAKDPTHALVASAVDFDDSAWEAVRVPHDWAISGPFDESAHGGSGKLPWKGVGWYRRTFTLAQADAGKSVFLDFDGVMASPEVYVNGQKAGGWDYGYASFRVDATPYVKFGERNMIAVRASTLDHRSRWYPGAGIYRKVTLRVRNQAHFAYNGIFVTTPQVSKDTATVRLEWELAGTVPTGANVEVAVFSPCRTGTVPKFAGTVPKKVGTVPAGQGSLSWQEEKPALWDVETPNLYEAEVALVSGGQTLSRERVRFGIRSIAFPVATGSLTNDWAANGFHLNGRRVQLKGVNLHSDLGLLGMAFDKSAMRRQLKIMKDMGANALRTSHNCPAPELLDLCDEMGILVWDECFDKWNGTASRRKDQNLEEYIARNLQSFVRRDRNHPCVVIWSMSNEIGEGPDGLTRERCRLFREKMRECDTSRPIGNGNIYFMSKQNVLDKEIYADLDITGWNYGACYRPVKAKYPAKPVVYSESASAFSTYGFYLNPPPDGKRNFANNQFQVDSHDHNAGPDIADVEFNYMEQDRYVCGEFVWTGIDYLGEPTPFAKESRSSYFGIVDLMGVPKDRYYLYRSHWNDKDETVHILPHWNWKGYEGRSVPVYVYTSGDSAELFLNGRSLGIRRKGKDASPYSSYYDVCAKYRLRWFEVPYEPGELKAVAYRGGKRIGEAVMRTAGEPAALKLTVEPRIADDPGALVWVHVDVLDAKGVRNPLAANRVNFRLDGPGKILGVGNGNPHAFEPFTKTDSHPLFFGKAMAVIRRDGPGELALTVASDGLAPATAKIP